MLEGFLISVGVLGWALVPRGAIYLEKIMTYAETMATRKAERSAGLLVVGELGKMLNRE